MVFFQNNGRTGSEVQNIAFASLKPPKQTQKNKQTNTHGSNFVSFISFSSVLKAQNFVFSSSD